VLKLSSLAAALLFTVLVGAPSAASAQEPAASASTPTSSDKPDAELSARVATMPTRPARPDGGSLNLALPRGDATLLDPKRIIAGFTLEDASTTAGPTLEVCGPEITFSIRFGR
jgi:hypothetical protein